MLGKQIKIRGSEFKISGFLGKGKSGYSYLADNGSFRYVLKKIHFEPCAYYSFGDKLKAETHAYGILRHTGIAIPELIEVNEHEQYLVKEYVEGETAARLVAQGRITDKEVGIISGFARKAYSSGINIDYFPTNFIITPSGDAVYIDYELNPYTDEWNFENWGIHYWRNTSGMKEYLETGSILAINVSVDSGIPIKKLTVDS